MYLIKTSEAFVNGKLQVMHISTKNEIYNQSEIRNLDYDDFICVIYIDGECKGEISYLLADAGCWVDMIDDIDWYMIYAETKYDAQHTA